MFADIPRGMIIECFKVAFRDGSSHSKSEDSDANNHLLKSDGAEVGVWETGGRMKLLSIHCEKQQS